MADISRKSNGQKKSKKLTKRRTSMGSKTPPLPSTFQGIEDLIKRRDYLKRKIESIDNSPKGNHSRKRKASEGKSNQQLHNIDKISHHNSLESISESDDEDHIINLRRQQRQKILENFDKSLPLPNKEVVVNEQKNDVNKDVNVFTARRTKQEEVVDMFSELNEFTYINTQKSPLEEDRLSDNIRDDKGYYCVRTGETLKSGRFVIDGLLGQGVFANVVRAHDKFDKNTVVAIKIIRKNDLIMKNSLREVSFLKQIIKADPEDKCHCIKFLGDFRQNGHICIVLELYHMNLRSFVKTNIRFGIGIADLQSYSTQLLLALQLLEKLKIIHADIKPDNILIDQSRQNLKLCDFGSATQTVDTRSPYLVSRYYRAPEIILGAPYGNSVDIWSLACTIFEMATGNIMFVGSSNNKMLKAFMEFKGRFPLRLIRAGIFKSQHFNADNEFIVHDTDANGRERFTIMRNEKPLRDLSYDLKKYCKRDFLGNNKKILQLKDFLEKMTMLDPNSRLSASEALKHSFLSKKYLLP